ncbi:MAG: DUF4494 domain-containing protein [Marinifilaceae bacterium]|jgi:hypothetical protein|nr:DUF4494 domain-containing protein [Marinilabiliaceae bacterium JC040]MCT4600782.1 DUF4494 domain-containing protein [Marinifilaceae bacterium]
MNSTHTWFECKVKYLKTGPNGKEVKINESYLIDAVSYTEAEARIFAELETFIQGPFIIDSIKKSNVSEVIPSNVESDDKWFKGKIALLDADEVTGQEKRTNQYVLVSAKDIHTALEHLVESFSTYVIPYEISQIADTKIMDVYPYFKGDGEEEIPENLKPISELE